MTLPRAFGAIFCPGQVSGLVASHGVHLQPSRLKCSWPTVSYMVSTALIGRSVRISRAASCVIRSLRVYTFFVNKDAVHPGRDFIAADYTLKLGPDPIH